MPASDPHPAPDRLVAYHEGRLSESEAERMQQHLADCPDCAAQLLGLADLLDEDGESARAELTPADLEAAWNRHRGFVPVAPVVPLAGRRSGRSSKPRPWFAAVASGLAAALAVVAIAQWRTIERLRQPQANPPLVNLEPADTVRRGLREIPELRFTEEAERAWVILNPAEDLGTASYRVAIAAEGGEVVLSFHGLHATDSGNLRLEVPRTALREGSYTARLHAESDLSQAIEEFEFTVGHLL